MNKRDQIIAVANRAGSQIAAWTPVERLLAVVCALAPLVMWWVDPGPLRSSISAYFAMIDNQWFYVPLAVGAMLFLVNGITKQKHWYNWVLGAALVGVLMFNTEDWPVVHTIFAVTFFGGNVAVMIWWSDAPAKYRYAFAGVVAVGMILLATDVISLWLAEFVSLLAIAAHYILDSSAVEYHALPRGQNPWSRSPTTDSAEAS